MEQAEVLLQVKGLKVSVETAAGVLPLIEDVNLELKPGRVLGLVGAAAAEKPLRRWRSFRC